MKKIISVAFALLLMTGCSGSRELENRDFVMAAGIEEDNGYKLTLAVAVPSTGEDSSGEKENIFEGRGRTVAEALENINNKTKGNIYMGHNRVIVLSDDIKNYSGIIDYFRSNIDISRDTVMVRADKPSEVIRAKNNDENFSGYIYDYFRYKDKIDLNKFMDYYNNSTYTELPAVSAHDDKITVDMGGTAKNKSA